MTMNRPYQILTLKILSHLTLEDLRGEIGIEDWQERVRLFHEIENLKKYRKMRSG